MAKEQQPEGTLVDMVTGVDQNGDTHIFVSCDGGGRWIAAMKAGRFLPTAGAVTSKAA